MKILYIHQYFATPKEPGGTRSYWISKELIKQGHQVTMLTTNKGRGKSKKVVIEDINVIYLNIPYSNHMSILQRLMSFMKFMLLSSWKVLKSKDYDLIIATSTPLTVGFPALIGKKLKNIPYLFEVRDLWPEVPVQMGGLKNKLAIKFAYWFENQIYKNAMHIVALSPGMRKGVTSTGVSDKKVTTIPNMSKIDKFWPREKKISLITELGLNPNSFKVVYFGSMGLANGMDYILDGAKFLNGDSNIEFVFLGGGSVEDTIKRRCKEEGIPHMNFYGRVPMDRLSEIVNVCDVSLVSFTNLPILATNSPNKLFDSLSAGKPIIVNSSGWTKDMVERHQCGVFVDPTRPKKLAEQIIKLKNDSALCRTYGENARKLAEEKFDKSILCTQFVELVESLPLS
ncbi:MAG: glycosyltransferase family 4 protein [Saonia sp.]